MNSTPSLQISQKTFFGKYEATIMSGVALVMMLVHHLIDPVWLNHSVTITPILPFESTSIDYLMGYFCKLCVGIFAFITGYSFWINRESAYDIKKLALRIGNFLIGYWIVYILFLLYAYLTNDTTEPTLIVHLYNLFGIHLNFSYICPISAWYVYFYLSILLISPLITFIFQQKITHLVFSLVVVITTLNLLVFLSEHYSSFKAIQIVLLDLCRFLPCVLMGAIIAKYDLFNKLNRMIRTENRFINLGLSISLLFLIFIARLAVFKYIQVSPFFFDAFFSFFFIFAFILMLRNLPFSQVHFCVGYIIGVNSMYLWFLQSIYFVGKKLLFPVLYASYNPIIIVVSSLIIILPLAMLLTYLQKFWNLNNFFLKAEK